MSLRHNLQQFIMSNSYVEATRTGLDKLEITDAVSSKANTLIAYGKCMQKIILPPEYTELETLTNADNTCIDTGIVTDLDNMEFEIKVKPSRGNWYILQNRNADGIWGLTGSSTGNRIAFNWQNSDYETFPFTMTRDTSKVYTIYGKFLSNLWTGWIINETDNILEKGNPVSYETFIPNDLPIQIFGNQRLNSAAAGNSVYYIKLSKGGIPVRYLIPARNNNTNIVGFYDMVTGDFLTPYRGSVIGGPVKTTWTPGPDTPLEILSNNGVIKGVSDNLFNLNPNNVTIGYKLDDTTGEPVANSSCFYYNAYIPITPSLEYMFYGRRRSDNLLSTYNTIAWYTRDKEWISNSICTADTIGVDMAPVNAAYARLSCNVFGSLFSITYTHLSKFNWMFCIGSEEKPYSIYGVITQGDSETLEAVGKNLYDINTMQSGYINGEGIFTPDNALYHSNLIPVEEGTTYTFSGIDGVLGTIKFVHGYDSNGNWVEPLAFDADPVTPEYCMDITIPAGISYVVLSGIRLGNQEDSYIQFEKSTRPTKYEKYLKQTYSMPTLLSITDEHADILDLISGSLQHKVGIKVLDGTEPWQLSQYSNTYQASILDNKTEEESPGLFCSHFPRVLSEEDFEDVNCHYGVYTPDNPDIEICYIKHSTIIQDVSEFRGWLAKQYALGTPVIVLYSCGIKLDEKVNNKVFTLTSGNNTIERKATSGIEGLRIETTYKKLR